MQTQMVNFNQYFMPVIIETLGQLIAKFNAASAGTITLTTTGFTGDFIQESFWKGIHSARRRVDRYSSNDPVAAIDLEQIKKSGVKVAGGFGPIRFEPGQMTWLEKPTGEAIEVVSRNFAEALLSDQLNTAIAALCAAIGNQAAAVNDISGAAGAAAAMTYAAMNNTHAKFGDQSGRLVAQVMTGAQAHKLIGQNLANGQGLFNAGGINVIDILGKAVIVTDAPALTVAGAPNKSRVLSLAQNAATVFDGGDVITNIDTTNGKGRIESTIQTDYTFGLSLLGYTWDEANGGKSPTDAELATGTNWDKVATDIKHTAGVMTVASADV